MRLVRHRCGNIVYSLTQYSDHVPDKHRHPPPSQNAKSERALCRVGDILEGASKEVSLSDRRTTLCVVRKDAAIYAYVNACPHTGAPLNWSGDQFLTRDGDMIQCAIHGALFRITDGVCIWGPCLHQRLQAVPTVIADNQVTLADHAELRLLHE